MRKNTLYFKALYLLMVVVLVSCSKTLIPLGSATDSYKLTTENALKKPSYAQTIEDFYNAGQDGYFNGKADLSIYYKLFEQPNADKAILISSGRTEAAIKYKELIYDLYNNGYSVYIHDHRGQGLSGRMTEDADMGYIDTFQYYIDDMHTFFETYIKPKGYKKKYLLAHSMGGAIGMTYIEQYHDDFSAAAFSSPMLGLIPPTCKLVKVLDGDQPKYALGESAYKDEKNKFINNYLTGSELRYGRMVDAFTQVPKARLGGASYTWVNKSCKQFKSIFGNIDNIRTPFILFSAENEQIVYTKAHSKFIKAAKTKGKDCKAYEVEDAQHELLIEKDEPRTATITKILDFYSSY